MTQKVAIVGSRDFPHLAWVDRYVSTLPFDDIIVSGGAMGVDNEAKIAARNYAHIFIEVIPAWNLGKRAGLDRNTIIVDIADRIVAFWDGRSRGTKDTIDKGHRAHKPVEIWTPRDSALGYSL